MMQKGLSYEFFILLNLNKTVVENVDQPITEPGCLLLIKGFAHTMVLGCTCVPGASMLPSAILSFFLSCGFL